MRTEKDKLLKKELGILAIETRERLYLSQKEMAALLYISEVPYSDIETGVYMCGMLTTLLLVMEQENPLDF